MLSKCMNISYTFGESSYLLFRDNRVNITDNLGGDSNEKIL